MPEVKCSFCGYRFDPAAGRAACGGCPLSRFCHKLKCPKCGFELAVPLPRVQRRVAKYVRSQE